MRRFAVIQRILIISLFLFTWELLCAQKVLNSFLFPPPSKIYISFVQLLMNGELITDVAISIQRVLVGFLLSFFTAIPLGLLLGTHKKINYYLSPIINFIKPIPPIAWIPIAIIWFGIGNRLTYFITMIASFFPIFINTITGVEHVPKEHINAARCFGASRLMLLIHIIIPAALAYIFSGIRIGLGFAWMAIVAAEMMTSISGLGYLITVNQQMLRLDRVLVGMAIIGSIGLLMDAFLVTLKKIIIKW